MSQLALGSSRAQARAFFLPPDLMWRARRCGMSARCSASRTAVSKRRVMWRARRISRPCWTTARASTSPLLWLPLTQPCTKHLLGLPLTQPCTKHLLGTRSWKRNSSRRSTRPHARLLQVGRRRAPVASVHCRIRSRACAAPRPATKVTKRIFPLSRRRRFVEAATCYLPCAECAAYAHGCDKAVYLHCSTDAAR